MRLVQFAILSALATSCLLALDAAQPTSRYLRSTFTVTDGLPSNVVNAIVQSQSGFLWVGTDAGLARFNGRRFTAVSFRSPSSSPQGAVRALALSPEGDLWIGTDTGLIKFPSTALDLFDSAQTSTLHPRTGDSDQITCLRFHSDGSLWVGTSQGLYRYRAAAFQLVVPDVWISRLEQTAQGHMLAVTSRGWLELDGTRIIDHPGFNERLKVAYNEVFNVMEDHNGDRWFANATGLARQHGNQITPVRPYGTRTETAWRTIEDPQNNLWVFTKKGLFRGTIRGLEPLALGMNAASVYSDRDGNLWVGRKGDGLVRFTNPLAQVFTVIPGPVITRPMTVLSASDGRLWVGSNCGGLAVSKGNSFQIYAEKEGITSSCVCALAEDAQKDIWAGTYGGGLFQLHKGVFRQFSKPQGLAGVLVRAIVANPDNSLWIATESGLSLMRDAKFRNYTTADGLSSNRVLNIYRDRKGDLWVATNKGVDHMIGDHFVHLPSDPEVFDSLFISLREDSAGTMYALAAPRGISMVSGGRLIGVNRDFDVMSMLNLGMSTWFAGVDGIFRFPNNEFGRTSESREGALDYEKFGLAEGISSQQVNLGVPNMAATPDGKLWIARVQGLTMIDTVRLPRSEGRPLTYVESVTIGSIAQPAGSGLTLPPGTHHVELHFDSLELAHPEKVRFQYRMEGVDSNWLDGSIARTAVYTSIPIGAHLFHIRATNANGIWDRAGVVYRVTQQPYLYETATFRTLSMCIAMLLLIAGYRRRLQQLERAARDRLHERLSERERIARELHDTLLQGIQGLILSFQAVSENIPVENRLHGSMENALERAEHLLAEGRDRVKDLRGVAECNRDLFPDLSNAGEEFARDFPCKFCGALGGDTRDLRAMACEEIYSIGLEALTNAFYHSRGSEIDLEVDYGRTRLILKVTDDGQGIEPAIFESGGRPGHWGITGMRERAARIGSQLDVISRVGAGTTIKLTVPATIAYKAGSRLSFWKNSR